MSEIQASQTSNLPLLNYINSAPIPINNFPHQIEGMTHSIWHTLYKRESNHFHDPFKPCLLGNRVDKIINEISKCHRSALSPECPDCQTKRANASYLNRSWLADIHTKNLNSLTTTKIGGDVKPLRAEAWSNDKNNNKRNEPLSKQMERELSRFSRSQQPTSLQAWVTDRKLSNVNKKSLQPIRANSPDTKDTDKEQRTVPIIPNKEPPVEDNNLVTKGETGTDNKSSAKSGPVEKEQTKENPDVPDNDDQLTPVVEVLAAVKEIAKEPDPPKETQSQSECIKDPPIPFGEDLTNITWVDADDNPWEYGSYLGGPYIE